jgi:hypothetical protein
VNYTALCTAIESYSENSFEASDLATFVKLAEQRLYNLVQTPVLRKNVTGTTTAANKYLACPTDLLSVFSLAVVDGTGAYSFLLNKDVNFIREAYPSPTDTGLPAYYAFFGSQSADDNELTFILGPTPDAGYTVELHYNYYPESIVTAGTSWLGDNYDSALLNAALMEAITFMKGEKDMVDLYQTRMIESITGLKNLSDGKQRQDAYRSGQVRTGVI